MVAVKPLNLIDGYKLDHRRQYPDKTERVYSNWTPRSSRVDGVDKVVFFGLQYFLDKYLNDLFDTAFFDQDIDKVAGSYTRRVNGYIGPNSVGEQHIRDLHALGYLPLEFKALPEGTEVPIGVPMLTVENTDDRFAWLVNYLESLMSCVLWMPCTSATNALHSRRLYESWADKTGAPKEFVDWQGHDFSFRGMAGVEAAQISGMGHLVAFNGTDTIPAIDAVEESYPVPDDYLIGGSVAATEHSVMCAGGKDDEQETFNRLLDLYPAGILSVVSDTWDLWNVVTNIVPGLKDRILARDGKLVIRPDSGDPVKIICGDPEAEVDSPAFKGVVELLWEAFGGTLTDKGYKVLDSHIGVIYGDAINYERANAILSQLAGKGFASNNIVFGMGSFTYQYVTRDTFGFAMKATWVQIDGEGTAIYKKPVTDDGGKFSARGRLAVVDVNGKLTLINDATPEQEADSLLKTVWKDSLFQSFEGFDAIRARVRA